LIGYKRSRDFLAYDNVTVSAWWLIQVVTTNTGAWLYLVPDVRSYTCLLL